MYVRIPNLLNEKMLARVEEILSGAAFVEGARTAGPQARKVKNNLQLDRQQTPEAQELESLLSQALSRHPLVRMVAMPTRVMAPMISKYETGMSYGIHADNPFIDTPQGRLRSDISCTIFLSDPDSYAGGDLVAATDLGPQRIKLPKGDAILYPTGTPHEVLEVTSGVRLAAVTWIESRVADPHKRQILAELDRLAQGVSRKLPDTPEQRQAQKLYGDLARLWG
ncbi:Fe2+-dependent dioxygenase [Magnetospira thiophila]